MECIKNYKCQGTRYLAGNEYDIDEATATAHENRVGGKLWKRAKKTSKAKSSAKTTGKKSK